MSGLAWFGVGFAAYIVGWFVYRWFQPSANQRAMCRMADFYALRDQERQGILDALDHGELSAREAYERLTRL